MEKCKVNVTEVLDYNGKLLQFKATYLGEVFVTKNFDDITSIVLGLIRTEDQLQRIQNDQISKY